LLLLFNWTTIGFPPSGNGTTLRYNTQKYTCHTKYHATLKQKTAHKATRTIKDTLHTMNITQKAKAIPVTGRGGLLGWVTSRIQHCPDSRFIVRGNVVSLTLRPRFTHPEIFRYPFLFHQVLISVLAMRPSFYTSFFILSQGPGN
jgi:hypothetical protein